MAFLNLTLNKYMEGRGVKKKFYLKTRFCPPPLQEHFGSPFWMAWSLVEELFCSIPTYPRYLVYKPSLSRPLTWLLPPPLSPGSPATLTSSIRYVVYTLYLFLCLSLPLILSLSAMRFWLTNHPNLQNISLSIYLFLSFYLSIFIPPLLCSFSFFFPKSKNRDNASTNVFSSYFNFDAYIMNFPQRRMRPEYINIYMLQGV